MAIRNAEWIVPVSKADGTWEERTLMQKDEFLSPTETVSEIKVVKKCEFVELPTTLRFWFVLEGKGTVFACDNEWEIQPRDMIFFPANTSYTVAPRDKSLRMLCFAVRTDEPSTKTSIAVKNVSTITKPDAVGHAGTVMGFELLSQNELPPPMQFVLEFVAIAPIEPHSHPTDEFFFVLEGTGIHWLDKKMLKVRPGDLIHIPPRLTHTLVPDGESCRCICVAVKLPGSPAD